MAAARGELGEQLTVATAAFEEIADDFEFLEDWESRYRYVIDLGKGMKRLETELCVPATKVDGCASQVWIVPEVTRERGKARFSFRGDSDAIIVRGLIAILASLYNGVAVTEVLKIDADAELGRLGLRNHLSSQRSNGLVSMVRRIRFLAQAARNSCTAVAQP